VGYVTAKCNLKLITINKTIKPQKTYNIILPQNINKLDDIVNYNSSV